MCAYIHTPIQTIHEHHHTHTHKYALSHTPDEKLVAAQPAEVLRAKEVLKKFHNKSLNR